MDGLSGLRHPRPEITHPTGLPAALAGCLRSHYGDNQQMFGAGSQDPHAGGSYEEAKNRPSTLIIAVLM